MPSRIGAASLKPWRRNRTAGQKSDSVTLYAIDVESGALKELKRYPLGKKSELGGDH